MDQTLGLSNATIQLAAVLSYQYLALVWPLYVVMIMLGLLIGMQTLAAGVAFSYIEIEKKSKSANSLGSISFLVALLYFLSCYHIHLIGYTIFAAVAATHVSIMMVSAFFLWSKK